MPLPRLLALDTSTDRLVVALVCGAEVLRVDEAGGARASMALLPAVQRLLAEAGLAMADLDAVAFGRGPGAFTGLRTACAAAQGLALGAACPVLPVDSLMLVADDARAQHGDAADDVWVAMDARMDEVYAAHYRWRGAWQAERAPALWTLEALNAAWQAAPPVRVAGSALDAFATQQDVRDARPVRLDVRGAHEVRQPLDRAGALARLARQAWDDGAAIDPAAALPVYLRDKVALTQAERDAAAAQPAERRAAAGASA